MVAEMLMNAEDELLEQAGMFVAEGDFTAALPLLERIAESGDEQQKEMAEAYLLQIGEMLPSENVAISSDFLIEDEESIVDIVIGGDSGEDTQAFFGDDDGVSIDFSDENDLDIDFSKDFLDENTVVPDVLDKAEAVVTSLIEPSSADMSSNGSFSIEPSSAETSSDGAFSIEPFSAEPTSAEPFVAEPSAVESVSVELSDFPEDKNSEVEELTESEALIEDVLSAKYEYSESVYVPKTSAKIIATTLGGLQQQTKDVAEMEIEIPSQPSHALQSTPELAAEETVISMQSDLPSLEASVSTSGNEMDVALEQVEMLLGDIDLETATLLLASVLIHGSPTQQSQANALLLKVSQSVEAPSINSVEPVLDDDGVGVDSGQVLSDDLLEKAAMLMAEGDNQGAKVLFERLAQSDDETQREMANAYLLQLSESEQQQSGQQPVGLVEEFSDATFEEGGFIGQADLLNPLDALRSDADFINLSSQVDVSVGTDEKEYRQGFYIGNVGLMIRYIDGSELTDMPKLYQLPNAPTWFLGVVNLHGLVVPVFDLAGYFGIDSRAIKKPKLLVLGQDEKATGIIIDGLPRRLSWGAEQKVGMNMVPDYLRPTTKAACLIEKALWFDLDINELMSSIETSII